MGYKVFLSPEDRASNVYASTAMWNGKTTNEKEQMGRCADYLEIALKRCGFDVINAQYGNMYDRVSASNQWPSNLHVALHSNGFNGQVAGTRVHCYPSEQSRKIGKLIQDRIAPLSPGTSERLVESDNLYELRSTTMPAVLPEFGFHDNPEEAQWLIDNMEAIAEETCAAICAFFDVPYVTPDKKIELEQEPVGKTDATKGGDFIRTINDLVNLALGEVGYLEKASNAHLDSKTDNAGYNNYTKYQRDMDAISGFYNGKKQGYSWCDVFVDWLFVKTFGVTEALRLLCQPMKSMGAGCQYSAGYYKEKGQFFSYPEVGDQIFFKSSSYSYAHTGIVVSVNGSTVTTVEGNTSGGSSVISNGGGVCKKTYSISYANIVGYGRPLWNEEQKSCAAKKITVNISVLKRGATGSQVKSLQALLNGYGYNCGSVDGDFGSKTYTALCKYQNAMGLQVDGSCGPKTWSALLGV